MPFQNRLGPKKRGRGFPLLPRFICQEVSNIIAQTPCTTCQRAAEGHKGDRGSAAPLWAPRSPPTGPDRHHLRARHFHARRLERGFQDLHQGGTSDFSNTKSHQNIHWHAQLCPGKKNVTRPLPGLTCLPMVLIFTPVYGEKPLGSVIPDLPLVEGDRLPLQVAVFSVHHSS